MFIIKLADKKSELKKAQALRYSIFYKEKKAKLTFPKKGIIFPKIRAINIRGKENKTKVINFRLKIK